MDICILLFSLFALQWEVQGKGATNPRENEGLFEGDIMGIDPFGDRNAIPRDAQRWPGGIIPYVFDSSLSGITQHILKGMKHIEQRTCIRFVKRTNQKDYLRIFRGDGCWSYFGRLGNGEQKLSLSHPGCTDVGSVAHELMHAIGFRHQHSRSDRDNYLKINWDNIKKKHMHNFVKLRPDENRLLVGFDFDSIMLYGSRDFSINGRSKTIEAKDGRQIVDIEDKTGLSKLDAKAINTLYRCP